MSCQVDQLTGLQCSGAFNISSHNDLLKICLVCFTLPTAGGRKSTDRCDLMILGPGMESRKVIGSFDKHRVIPILNHKTPNRNATVAPVRISAAGDLQARARLTEGNSRKVHLLAKPVISLLISWRAEF